jgi:hypothetical protein
MVKISDGQTDLVSTLLSTSQDAQGKPIKWKRDGDNDSLPSFSAEVKNDDGSKSFFSISLAKSLGTIGVRTELSEAQKKAQEKRAAKTNVRDGKVLQNNPVTGKPSISVSVAKEEPDSKEDKEAEKRAEKESEVGFTRRR